MARVYNFSAGPSMLPESVLKKAAAEMLDYEGSGQSVMEMSHRSKIYGTIIEGAEALLREVMNIPDNYKVLFLQGGASTQFAAIPMNLMTKSGKSDYVITGQWAKKAHAEAARYGQANVVASSADKTFTYIPKLDPSTITKDADYFYICMNNTIYGTVYHELPDTGDVPLVADISSCILPGQKIYRVQSDEFIVLDFAGGTEAIAIDLYKRIRSFISKFVADNHYEAVFTISARYFPHVEFT